MTWLTGGKSGEPKDRLRAMRTASLIQTSPMAPPHGSISPHRSRLAAPDPLPAQLTRAAPGPGPAPTPPLPAALMPVERQLPVRQIRGAARAAVDHLE